MTNEELLKQSTEVATNAAKIAGLPEFKPGYAITGNDLAPSSSIDITYPEKKYLPSIKNINADIISPSIPKNDFSASTNMSELENLISKIEGKEATTQSRITQATSPVVDEINKLNTQIKMLQADQVEKEERARQAGETTGFSTGEQSRENAEYTAKALRLSATAEALKGNYELAKQQAESAIQSEFSQLEADLRTKKANIINNYDNFTSSEKKQAEVLLLRLDSQDQFVQSQKEERKNIFSVQQDAIKNGITNADVLQQIGNAGTAEEANNIMAVNLPIKAEKLSTSIVDVEGRKLLVDTQTGETIKDLGTSDSIISSDPSIDYYSQLLSEGKINVSNVPQKIRNAVITASKGNINARLSDTAITKINDTNYAITSLQDLRAKIQTNIDQIGPITGLEALNPWSEKRQLQADIDRVRQTVGKALEGGVLRKEDEEKYKKILATITDTPETALYKIDALISSIQTNIEDYKSLQSSSGKYVPNSKGILSPDELRNKYNY
jgi:hypothetical protein